MPVASARKREYDKAWYARNVDRVRAANAARMRRWYAENPELARQRRRAYWARNVERERARLRARYAKNAEAFRAASKAWREKNPEKAARIKAEWVKENPERVRAMKTRWKLKNRGRVNADTARRRAGKRARTPPLTPAEKHLIVAIYRKARQLTELVGEPYHVDHIKPLSKGGLHHPRSLQVLRGVDNLRKGAK